jgi:hypothetical protein
MDEDLGVAVRKALGLTREAARAHAGTFTWAHCTELFQAELVPAFTRQHRAA